MSNLRRIVEQDDNPDNDVSVVTLDSFLEDLLAQAKSGQSWSDFYDKRHEKTAVILTGQADLTSAMRRVWDALQE